MEDDAQAPRPLDYAGPSTGQMVPVARSPQDWMAVVALTKLESEGIVADLADATPLHGLGTRAATLVVQGNHVDDAIRLLQETPARQYLPSRK